ncbi:MULTISPECIES: hypothetical protein [Xanthomonas]|uniref:hypothetical protein n=1 Tax=Xanthomonas TaxID=338 RepID=UPI000C86A3B9|nr:MULTISPECIES: hypothetical protein [Xanthomonas]MEA9769908.1 hypothetical protein [Xanthomonas campestris pv. raphani]MEA9797811.1 hypothetical protein [Xanthomonas campestris pv. raphani]PMR87940.1 hypothetical protein C1H21_01510 [Xanthomonas arboricola pv. juglandis]
MLEFIGTVAVCAVGLWLARYFWNFWRFRQSISAVEALASAVKSKADFVAARAGADAAEKTYFISICLKSLADSLSYGKVANPLIAGTQLEVLEGMIGSPEDVAYFMNKPVEAIIEIRLGLMRARDSFALLHRVIGVSQMRRN